MNLNNKKIGIWGYGIMGKATAAFLAQQGFAVQVFDQRPIENTEQKNLAALKITLSQNLEHFFADNDFIVPSGGVDLRPYPEVHTKLLPELDLFYYFFKKPIIAITGTLGKTTVTTILAQTLQKAGKNIAIGGNIGVGLCELIEKQDLVDYAVIEVSSFQLEHCKSFAPDLAIWTNFYPNHLDRHTTLNDYFAAKKKILAFQRPEQKALLPASFYSYFSEYSRYHYFSIEPLNMLQNVYCIQNEKKIISYNNNALCDINTLPKTLYPENALILVAALDILGLPATLLAMPENWIEHRLEKVAEYNGITFYNDSKSTVPEATLAAVEQLKNKNLILFLGGLSKGVDRKPFVANLKNKVQKIYCFGKEAEQLLDFCKEFNIPAVAHTSLDAAFNDCMLDVEHRSAILFSPSGSSFDLFANYQERGKYFKSLVNRYKERI